MRKYLLLPFRFLMSIFCLISLFSNCDSKSEFRNAWNRNDTIYIRNYIQNLTNKNVEEIGAIAETVLSTQTNFAYGMMLFERRHGKYFWDSISKHQKEIIKYNIIAVWSIYLESDLFIKKGCKGSVLIDGEEKNFQELYHPFRKSKFSSIELIELKKIMNKIAQKCDDARSQSRTNQVN